MNSRYRKHSIQGIDFLVDHGTGLVVGQVDRRGNEYLFPLIADVDGIAASQSAAFAEQAVAWADRGVGLRANHVKFISDLGQLPFKWDGEMWRILIGLGLVKCLPAKVIGVAQTAAQVLGAQVLPAGLWGKNGDQMHLEIGLEKSAAVETGTVKLHIGATGTPADTEVWTSGIFTTRSVGTIKAFRRESATTIAPIGSVASNTTGSGAYSFTGTTAANVSTPVTVPNLDTQGLIASISVSLSAGAEIPVLQMFNVTMKAAS